MFLDQLLKLCDRSHRAWDERHLPRRRPTTARILSREEALLIAVQKHDFNTCVDCLAHGARVNCMEPVSGITPLMIAVAQGDAGLCRLLLENGADPNCFRDAQGSTPLLFAVINGYPQLCMLLADHGADLRRGPLLLAAHVRGGLPMVAALVSLGAVATKVDRECLQEDGKAFRLLELPPLHAAAASGYLPLLQRHLERGEAPYGCCSRGRTPVETAFAYDQPQAAEFIRGWVVHGQVRDTFLPPVPDTPAPNRTLRP